MPGLCYQVGTCAVRAGRASLLGQKQLVRPAVVATTATEHKIRCFTNTHYLTHTRCCCCCFRFCCFCCCHCHRCQCLQPLSTVGPTDWCKRVRPVRVAKLVPTALAKDWQTTGHAVRVAPVLCAAPTGTKHVMIASGASTASTAKGSSGSWCILLGPCTSCMWWKECC